MRYLRGRKGRMEANSSRGKKSAESRGSCSEDLGTRGRGQVLTETRDSCSSPENLETNEQNNGQRSQIRSLSLQLIQSTEAKQKMIKPRVAYGILNRCKSSEHDLVLLLRDDDRNRAEELHSLADLQYLLINTMRLVQSRREEFCQRGFCSKGCGDSMSRGTMWLQTSRKERWSRLKLMRRWFWRRRPPDARWRSSVEMGGHPFKHRRKKDFEKFSRFYNLHHDSFFLF